MVTITPFLKRGSGAFEPDAIQVMSRAFDEVCAALMVHGDPRARDVIAARIIELARRGELDADRLRDRVLRESGAPAVSEGPEEVPGWRGLT